MSLEICYPHKRRIENLSGSQEHLDRYYAYASTLEEAIDRGDTQAQLDCINEYRTYAKNVEISNPLFGFRTKYYSSILEELPVFLTQKTVKEAIESQDMGHFNFHLGAKECIIRIYSDAQGGLCQEKKLIDFAVCVDKNHSGNWVPLVGLEAKKYVDKTMFDSIVSTHDSLKKFRPRTYYGFVVEDEARACSVVENSPMMGQEFILTGHMRDRDKILPFKFEEYDNFATSLIHTVKASMEPFKKQLQNNGFKL